MLYALLITLATLLPRFPFAFGLHTLGDGGFSDSLLIGLTSADHHLLDTRQLSQGSIPTTCDSICNPVITALNSTCTETSCCTSSFEESIFQCYTCLEDALHETNFTQAQGTIDVFYNLCTSLGFSLPILTFPGQNANRPLSTLPASASSTARTTSSISQVTVTGTSATNPFATISQTTVTTLTKPATTQTSTSTTAPASTSSTKSTSDAGRKMKSSIPMWTMGVMGGAWIYLSLI